MRVTQAIYAFLLCSMMLIASLSGCNSNSANLQERLKSPDYSVRVLALADSMEQDIKATGYFTDSTTKQVSQALEDFPAMSDRKSYSVLKSFVKSRELEASGSRNKLAVPSGYVWAFREIVKREGIG